MKAELAVAVVAVVTSSAFAQGAGAPYDPMTPAQWCVQDGEIIAWALQNRKEGVEVDLLPNHNNHADKVARKAYKSYPPDADPERANEAYMWKCLGRIGRPEDRD